MQFQFRAGDQGASTYVPRGTAPSLMGGLWCTGEDTGSEYRVAAELLAAHAFMRREIEGQLRRELMMERESVILRAGAGLLFLQPIGIVVQPPRLERLNTMDGALHRAQLLGFQDTAILASMGGVHRNSTATEMLQNSIVPSVTTPVGIKRKAEEAANGELTLLSSKKKTDKKWICTLCQASSTCEQGLQNHFQGKKHKAKEAALKKSSEKTQNCKSPDPLPGGDEGKSQLKDKQGARLWCPVCEISTNSRAIMESHLRGKKHLAKLRRKSRTLSPDDAQEVREMTGREEEDLSSSKAERTEEIEAKKEDAIEEREKQQAVNQRQTTRQKFWCETCKIGATTEELMKEHQNGKKHMALLRKNGGALIVQTYGEATLPEEKKETHVEERWQSNIRMD